MASRCILSHGDEGDLYGRISPIFRDLKKNGQRVSPMEAAEDLEKAGVEDAKGATNTLLAQCRNSPDETKTLEPEDVTEVKLYTSEGETDPNVYTDVNSASNSKDRLKLLELRKKFIWNLLWALRLMDPYMGSTVVHRGVKKNLVKEYPRTYQEGKKVTWWGFTSTTKRTSVLANDMFLGKVGPRTIFCIELTQGAARDISRYSMIPEGEVLLPPGTTVEIVDISDLGHELTMIRVKEVEPIDEILSLRAAKPASDSSYVTIPADQEDAKKTLADKYGIHNTEEEGKYRKKPIHFAAEDGHAEKITLLLQAKADVNAKDQRCYTPMHSAACYGQTEALTLLAQATADVNAKDRLGSTPMHWAASEGKTEALTLLAQAKADVNAKNQCGRTPLMIAQQKRHNDAESVLLQLGAR
eukprot:TRINITY_DN8878_c0_g3_i4.p1 TRINITY_DN8878_c0_g3~~TRINITY_DN8878_c0_g3_i4.p1  ORF type:complete len:431 (-),score=87.69 TRINITY_DN8878_c0_g3_i4:124-1362(-)